MRDTIRTPNSELGTEPMRLLPPKVVRNPSARALLDERGTSRGGLDASRRSRDLDLPHPELGPGVELGCRSVDCCPEGLRAIPRRGGDVFEVRLLCRRPRAGATNWSSNRVRRNQKIAGYRAPRGPSAWHMLLVETWKDRGERGASGGRKAYAARQRALWQGLHDHASGVFAVARASKSMPELTLDG